ncbi:MAG: hypothetical protein OXH11_09335, partial [Candidatus Aminicenantes bacterium]|nr:hypothetical protein [Candidatus Aminicenantes bacterium]
AKVLNEGVSRLVSRGLDRDYLVVHEDIRGLKGKLDFPTTIKKTLLLHGKTHCSFDDLSYDVPQNQILKATLRQLTLVTVLDPFQRRRAERLYRKLDTVSDVPLSPRLFRTVQIHRNNRFYSFLLHLCRMIYDNLLVNQEKGTTTFYDFREDEQQMWRIFQAFVRTFYARETNYRVSAPKIDWFGAENRKADLRHLPGMDTDIVLESSERTIILDTKFYKNPLDSRYGEQRVRSSHLYQIFSYVMNWAADTSAEGPQPEGWLLYAAVDRGFDYRFELMSRPIRACSINLAQDWKSIESDLMNLVAAGPH